MSEESGMVLRNDMLGKIVTGNKGLENISLRLVYTTLLFKFTKLIVFNRNCKVNNNDLSSMLEWVNDNDSIKSFSLNIS